MRDQKRRKLGSKRIFSLRIPFDDKYWAAKRCLSMLLRDRRDWREKIPSEYIVGNVLFFVSDKGMTEWSIDECISKMKPVPSFSLLPILTQNFFLFRLRTSSYSDSELFPLLPSGMNGARINIFFTRILSLLFLRRRVFEDRKRMKITVLNILLLLP